MQARDVPPIVLILDHDETFAISERDANGRYIIQPDGSIKAKIMDEKKLRRIVALTQLFQIPIHVVTARADIPGDRKVVEEVIGSANGFDFGPGGFKRDYIHFAGTKKAGVWKQIFTKAEIIEYIHQAYYPHLPCDAFLFVDDMLKYLEGVMQAGFMTFQANPETKEHFDLIEEFILNKGKFYTYQPMLFKTVIDAIPSERNELLSEATESILEDGIKALHNNAPLSRLSLS